MRIPISRLGAAMVAAAVLVVLAAPRCAGSRPAGEEKGAPKLSAKLNPFIYFVEGAELFVAVDGRAARYHRKDPIFPLGIGLANNRKTPVTLSLESFTLEDEEGNEYPVASMEEYNRGSSRSRMDAEWLDSLREAMSFRFANVYEFVPWRFFPTRGGLGTASDRMELPRASFTRGYLYFPLPPGGIHAKRFRLRVKGPDLAETYEVAFSLK